MVDRYERVRHGLRRLSSGDDVDELARSRHVHGVRRDHLAAERLQVTIQRLHDQQLDAGQAGGLDGGDDGARHSCQLHARYSRSRAANRASAARFCAISAWSWAMTRQVGRSVAPAAATPAPAAPTPILDSRLDLGDRAAEEEVALATQVIGQPELQELDPCPLEAGVGRPDGRRDGVRLDDAQRFSGGLAAFAAYAGYDAGMDVGQEDHVADGRRGDLAAGLQRLLDIRHGTAHEDEVSTRCTVPARMTSMGARLAMASPAAIPAANRVELQEAEGWLDAECGWRDRGSGSAGRHVRRSS